MNTTLPTDSNDRKNYALFRGCFRYFPAALAGVAKTSKEGNDKHNPGEDMYHARGKSADHGDCVLRHLMDLEDMVAALDRGEDVAPASILVEVDCMAWRALALSQALHERFGSPLAPGAKATTESKKKEDGISLHAAAEKAQADVQERVAANKKNIFNAPKFLRGDIIKHINNDVDLLVEGTYYDERGNPVVFVKDPHDPQGKTMGVDPSFYKSIYKEKEAK